MPVIDLAVLLGVVLGTVALGVKLRRSGLRGSPFIRRLWIGFTGVLLVVAMAAHCLDVASRWYVGVGHDGAPWAYDFRIYSLLLLGLLLGACGAALLRAAGASSEATRPQARSATFGVLLLTLPLVPIHGVFAIPVAALAGANLLALSGVRR